MQNSWGIFSIVQQGLSCFMFPFFFSFFFFSRLLIWDQLIDMIDDIFSLASWSRSRLFEGLVCCCCWYYYDYYCSKRIFLRLSRKEEEKKRRCIFFCLPSSFLNMYIIKKQRNKHRYTTNYDKFGLTLSYARRKKNVPIRNRWFFPFYLDFRQCTNRALAKLYVKDEEIELAKVNRNLFNDWLITHSFIFRIGICRHVYFCITCVVCHSKKVLNYLVLKH